MRKHKGWAIIFVCTAVFLSGCAKDYVPESYGGYDGNYLYIGNGRARTTGEEFETLVSEVVIDGFTYKATSCYDYDYCGDNAALALNCHREIGVVWDGDSQRVRYEDASCIVAYNFQSKQQTLLCASESVHDLHIKTALEDKVIYTIDFNEVAAVAWDGTPIEGDYFALDEYARYGDRYWVKNIPNEGSYYRTLQDETDRLVCDEYHTIEKYSEEGDGFFVTAWNINELSFYDIGTGETVLLTQEGTHFALIDETAEGDYFVSYTPRDISYEKRMGFFEKERFTTTVHENCVLYKIEYDGANTKAVKVLSFDKNKSFSDIRAIKDGKAYVLSRWVESASGCNDGGTDSAYYEAELSTGKLTELEYEVWNKKITACKDGILREQGQRVGEYVYFIRTERLQPLWGMAYPLYIFSRYDGEKTEALQFTYDYDKKKLHYSKELWQPLNATYGDEGLWDVEFAVREY